MDLAVRDRRIPSNPAAGVPLPPKGVARRRYLTAAQVEALADAAGRWSLVIYVLAYCGIRWGELAGLRVGRVNLLRHRLSIEETVTEVEGVLTWGPPKDYERRSVPVPPFLVERLRSCVEGRGSEGLVFVGERKGGPLRVRVARDGWFKKAAAAIDVPDLTPHELRHTAASLAVHSGASVLAVQRMLGHASAAMTLDTYSDLFDADLDLLADSLDEVRGRALADYLRTKSERTHLRAAPE